MQRTLDDAHTKMVCELHVRRADDIIVEIYGWRQPEQSGIVSTEAKMIGRNGKHGLVVLDEIRDCFWYKYIKYTTSI